MIMCNIAQLERELRWQNEKVRLRMFVASPMNKSTRTKVNKKKRGKIVTFNTNEKLDFNIFQPYGS